ncbi:MAG: hypothetical protein ACJAYU_004567 [Bradymonadia bacterium]|jgi:hypothetical protein
MHNHELDDLVRDAAGRQLAAYNAHDIEAFVGCYHPDVEVYDLPTGALRMQGRAALRTAYGEMFEASPNVHATLTSRTTVGRFAFDREVVTGRGERVVHAMATYEVDEDGLIRRGWFVVD